ncbi:hypothetical protein NL676_013143 [Syzygium grande]|nr:hypothetical protein NL676_013143 [Syzygium grande]
MALATIKNCNITLGNVKSLGTPMGMLLQIELLVIFAGFLLLFLIAFGSWRRFYNSRKFRLVIFTAYTISTYVLTYALGLMNDAPFRNELFPIWAMFLMLVLGSADSITAYSLEDNEQWRRYNWQIEIKLIWLIVLIVLSFHNKSKAAISATVFLALILLQKSDERARALMAASRHSLERSTKVVADYMRKEHESGGGSCGEVDPVRMKGYPYLVWGEEGSILSLTINRTIAFLRRIGIDTPPAEAPDYQKKPKVLDEDQLITIEKVWTCEGSLLRSGDPHNELKDTCLSFALFKLLRLRYADYSLPQKAHDNTWKLIRDGLLSQEDGYERVFRVVEVELTFLFDFFYTKYGIMFQSGWLLNKLTELIYVVAGIWAMTSLLKHYKRPNSNCLLATMPNGLSVDVLVTSVMIISFIIMEFMQFFFLGFSEWAKVKCICMYVRMKSCQDKVWIVRMIRAICGVRLLKPWERKLRQYTFLESYSHKPCFLLYNAFMAAYIDQTRDGQEQSRPIKLSKEVKIAVFDALKSNNGTKLENGQASLRAKIESQKLLWACQLETQTQVIMVWHIATSFCENQMPVRSDPLVSSDSAGLRNFLVATSLSKYLAYLVAFAPRLLPDHPYVVEYVFDQAIIEARIFFRECKGTEDRIRNIKGSSKGETVIKRGAALGNQLVHEIEDKDKIWKILADFWVELMLYVAPSDDVKAHAEHLTRGGEFVTHLWALLSHAGIKRDHSSV